MTLCRHARCHIPALRPAACAARARHRAVHVRRYVQAVIAITRETEQAGKVPCTRRQPLRPSRARSLSLSTRIWNSPSAWARPCSSIERCVCSNRTR